MNTIVLHYKTAIAALKKKPIRLWGLSLLCILLSFITSVLAGAVPIISLPIVFTLSAGLSLLFLNGIRGFEAKTEDLFAGFKDFKRVACGMGWMALWIFIWALIPIVGIIFAIIKSYEYRFTPYILMTRDDVSALDAIKVSKKMTYGIKGKMFWSEAFVEIAYVVVMIVLSVFASIPYIGVLFGVVEFIVVLLCCAFLPIFLGLIGADYYETALHPAPAAPVAPAAPTAPVAPAAPAAPAAPTAPAAPVAPEQPQAVSEPENGTPSQQ